MREFRGELSFDSALPVTVDFRRRSYLKINKYKTFFFPTASDLKRSGLDVCSDVRDVEVSTFMSLSLF